MLKIAQLVGARPQFIKCAPVQKELDRLGVGHFLIHSGQHYDEAMSEAFFKELNIAPPKHQLNWPLQSTEAIEIVSRAIADVLEREKPNVLIVYGDTNTTLAGALAAEKTGTPLAHIEAGLRSFNRAMPEEYNRVKTDALSKWLFCPNEESVENLSKEGIFTTHGRWVECTGDVMLDNLLHLLNNRTTSHLGQWQNTPFALLTLHRNFNVDHTVRLKSLINNVLKLAELQNTSVLWILHPRVQKSLQTDSELIQISRHPLLHLEEPMSYTSTIHHTIKAEWVMTDSGGLQKEAGYLGKRVLILRAETEWMEWVDRSQAFLVDDDLNKMVLALSVPITEKKDLNASFKSASASIVKTLINTLKP